MQVKAQLRNNLAEADQCLTQFSKDLQFVPVGWSCFLCPFYKWSIDRKVNLANIEITGFIEGQVIIPYLKKMSSLCVQKLSLYLGRGNQFGLTHVCKCIIL